MGPDNNLSSAAGMKWTLVALKICYQNSSWKRGDCCTSVNTDVHREKEFRFDKLHLVIPVVAQSPTFTTICSVSSLISCKVLGIAINQSTIHRKPVGTVPFAILYSAIENLHSPLKNAEHDALLSGSETGNLPLSEKRRKEEA